LILRVCKEYVSTNNLEMSSICPGLKDVNDKTRGHSKLWDLLATSMPNRSRLYHRWAVLLYL
jgi:hypothetical protein